MGLDWNPLARPKSGHEAELAELVRKMDAGALPEPEQKKLIERFQEITDPPFALLNAPRVGIDPEADAWLRERLEAVKKADKFAEAREQMRGFHVLDLLPACDGFPRYSNAGLYEGVDRCSFRAQFLSDLTDVIGLELYERGHHRMTAEELARYADALEAKVMPWAKQNGVAELATKAIPPDEDVEEGSAREKADVLFSALRWCRYWSARGHGLEPWF